jgi:signal transduction protein with GAF and PtsI domain
MASDPKKPPVIIPLYGVTICEAVASGDLAKMKEVARQAEDHVREWGNVPAALESLKMEISKLEKKAYRAS